MRAETVCERMHREISAKLDGELRPDELKQVEAHLDSCAECRNYESRLRTARRSVRVQPVRSVPDLTDRIMDKVRSEGVPTLRRERRDEIRSYLRTGMVAAVVAALLFIGVTTPFEDRPADIAGATEIVGKVKDAARALESFQATFSITERNWHPDIELRRFRANVWFEAPERFRLQLRDVTAYPDPSRWPRNNVDLVANPSAWWIREPFSCPVEALPDCAVAADDRERSIVGRGPFDGTAALPTDIVVPVETVSAGGIDVVGNEEIAGRQAHRLKLSYRQAFPLIAAVQPGGSWRPFHPLDEVELWLDRETSVPLRFRVIAGSSRERARWAETNFLDDRPREVVLDVEATSFSLESSPNARFDVPRTEIRTDAGFERGSFVSLGAGRAPSYTAGLAPYRAGTSPSGKVISYTDGLAWLKLSYRRSSGAGYVHPSVAEEIELANGYAYYRPADESLRRTLDIFDEKLQVHIESNLAREALFDVAETLALRGRKVPVPGPARRIGNAALERMGWVLLPTSMPEDYNPTVPSAAIIYKSHGQRTVVTYYRNSQAELEPGGIRITQRAGGSLLPPASEAFPVTLPVGDARARWSPERSELEWIDDGVYRAVYAPTFDLSMVVEIARSLR